MRISALSGSPVSYCGTEIPNGSATPDAAILPRGRERERACWSASQQRAIPGRRSPAVNATGRTLGDIAPQSEPDVYRHRHRHSRDRAIADGRDEYGGLDHRVPCVPATASLTPNLAAFSAQQGATTLPKSQIFTVTSTSTLGPIIVDPNFNYQGASSGWLTATVTGDAVTLTPNTTGLQPATYLATVQVSAALASNNPLLIHVSYVVTAVGPNLLTVSPNILYFVSPPGGSNPPGQVVTFTSPAHRSPGWSSRTATRAPQPSPTGSITYTKPSHPPRWRST